MSKLDIVVLLLISLKKELWQSLDPTTFGPLSEYVSMIKGGRATLLLVELLRNECGVVWDGKEKIDDAVIRHVLASVKLDAEIKIASRRIGDLTYLRHVLRCPNAATDEELQQAYKLLEAKCGDDKG